MALSRRNVGSRPPSSVATSSTIATTSRPSRSASSASSSGSSRDPMAYDGRIGASLHTRNASTSSSTTTISRSRPPTTSSTSALPSHQAPRLKRPTPSGSTTSSLRQNHHLPTAQSPSPSPSPTPSTLSSTSHHVRTDAPTTLSSLSLPSHGPSTPTSSTLSMTSTPSTVSTSRAKTGTAHSGKGDGFTTGSHVSLTGLGPLDLFLYNLHMLEMDSYSDWPGITAASYAPSPANLTRRIRSTEWALFHLFRLWVPRECHDKLQPFFPPQDQSQSLNLRAAMLRLLEQARKDAFLGREVVLRKTMLDECVGERFEDLLCSFSGAVLVHTMSQGRRPPGSQSTDGSVTEELVLAKHGYGSKPDPALVSTLSLAYRVSLQRILREKESSRHQYQAFSEELQRQQERLLARHKDLEVRQQNGPFSKLTQEDKAKLWHTLRGQWQGKEEWLEVMVGGDSRPATDDDVLLDGSFEQALQSVSHEQNHKPSQPKMDSRNSILVQVNEALQRQKQSVTHWRAIYDKISAQHGPPQPELKQTPPKQLQQQSALRFSDHVSLRFRPTAARLPNTTSQREVTMTDEYRLLMDAFAKDVAKLSETQKTKSVSSLATVRSQSWAKHFVSPQKLASTTLAIDDDDDVARVDSQPVSDISDLEEDPPFKQTNPISPVSPSSHPKPRPSISNLQGTVTWRPRVPSRKHEVDMDLDLDLGLDHSLDTKCASLFHPDPSQHHRNSSQRDREELHVSDPRLRRHAQKASYSTADDEPCTPPRASASHSPSTPTDEPMDSSPEDLPIVPLSPATRLGRPRQTLSLQDRSHLSLARKNSQIFQEQEDEEEDKDVLRRRPSIPSQGSQHSRTYSRYQQPPTHLQSRPPGQSHRRQAPQSNFASQNLPQPPPKTTSQVPQGPLLHRRNSSRSSLVPRTSTSNSLIDGEPSSSRTQNPSGSHLRRPSIDSVSSSLPSRSRSGSVKSSTASLPTSSTSSSALSRHNSVSSVSVARGEASSSTTSGSLPHRTKSVSTASSLGYHTSESTPEYSNPSSQPTTSITSSRSFRRARPSSLLIQDSSPSPFETSTSSDWIPPVVVPSSSTARVPISASPTRSVVQTVPQPTETPTDSVPSSIGSPSSTSSSYHDLVSRTRQSMANYDVTRQKVQIERRRSQRQSQQFQSRRESLLLAGRAPDDAFDPTPSTAEHEELTSELMSQEHDYEAIFRSRPKIKASPPSSPLKNQFYD